MPGIEAMMCATGIPWMRKTGTPEFWLQCFTGLRRSQRKRAARFLVTGCEHWQGACCPSGDQTMTRHQKTFAMETQHAPISAEERVVIYEARQILLRHLNQNPVLSSWQAVLDYCALTIRGEVERFHVLYLDKKNRLISDECLATGTVDHVPVYPREVLKRGLELNATALILVHNHPSGDPEPSRADITMTKEIRKGCQVLGLTLHDHIIVGIGREVSLRARGEI
ncbi:DNA repair protein RadC [Labrenzia sp. R4_2]|uniref:JAB domain-containing protein n=2 Tax=Hyphomicrobiales TaxID=356 RepID=UPI00336A4F3F